MYLTAQKVVRPKTEETGINVFFHEHGRTSWPSAPQPEDEPGKLARDRIRVAPPGNRVRSYIDLVAPDGTPSKVLLGELAKFLTTNVDQPLPWVASSGPYLFRVGMEASLAKTWRTELVELMTEALKLLTP